MLSGGDLGLWRVSVGLLGILLVDSLIVFKKRKKNLGSPCLCGGGMNDGFDCCVGILIFLLSDPRFFFLARLFSNFRLAVVL